MSGHVVVSNIAKKFVAPRAGQETEALAETSFVLRDAEVVCLLGPSGCGKSTVLRIIAGFDFPTAGTVTVNGAAVTRPGPDRGVVFQEQTLFPWLTIHQNIVSGPKFRGLKARDYESKARDYLRIIGLEAFAGHYPHELSGGMKQRVAIARALINEPAVLLMDEPFGALDAQTRIHMQEWLLSVWQDAPRPILFITHDVEEAIFLGDRVLVMSPRPGRVKQAWDVGLPRPRDMATRASSTFVALKAEVMACLREDAPA